MKSTIKRTTGYLVPAVIHCSVIKIHSIIEATDEFKKKYEIEIDQTEQENEENIYKVDFTYLPINDDTEIRRIKYFSESNLKILQTNKLFFDMGPYQTESLRKSNI